MIPQLQGEVPTFLGYDSLGTVIGVPLYFKVGSSDQKPDRTAALETIDDKTNLELHAGIGLDTS